MLNNKYRQTFLVPESFEGSRKSSSIGNPANPCGFREETLGLDAENMILGVYLGSSFIEMAFLEHYFLHNSTEARRYASMFYLVNPRYYLDESR